jgi:hypothetical protein
MPSNRPNLMLNEQAFQDLLSAAFTIQEHGDLLKQVRPAEIKQVVHSDARSGEDAAATTFCQHCGVVKRASEPRCGNCGLDEFRPGERMQRKWASMWQMSQDQGVLSERPVEVGGVPREIPKSLQRAVPPERERRGLAHPARDSADNGFFAASVARETAKETSTEAGGETAPRHRFRSEPAFGQEALDNSETEAEWTPEYSAFAELAREAAAPEGSAPAVETFGLSASDDVSETDEISDETNDEAARRVRPSLGQRFANFRVTLRFNRGNLYLGAAVFMAAVALMWPAVSAPRRAAFGPVDRALVALGIVEAPPPAVHMIKGDPGVNVWVDPHTALYYCPGEEQYGKTADGRFSSQHEAQMDRFQPAGRSPCE